MVRDSDACSSLVDLMLSTVADTPRLDALSRNIKEMALVDADARIVDVMEKILKK